VCEIAVVAWRGGITRQRCTDDCCRRRDVDIRTSTQLGTVIRWTVIHLHTRVRIGFLFSRIKR